MGGGQSNDAPDTSDREIVIVGGGYGGAYLAYKLVKGKVGKVKLINPRNGMFHSIAALRASVDEKFRSHLFASYDHMGGIHVKGQAVALDTKNKTVTLDDDQKISYTHLVIATGTSSPFPGKLGLDNPTTSKEEVLQKYEEYHKEIVASKRIVLVGAGAVGVEMSGEIKTEFPDKSVTIINSRNYFITQRSKPGFQKKIANVIRKRGIQVMENERVANLGELTTNKNVEGQIVKTDSGKEVECDMVIPCTGTRVNNQFFKEELGDALSEHGALCVNEYLQVKGHEDIYAIGDVNNVAEEKMAATAKFHADTVYKSLKSVKGKEAVYKTEKFLMVVPVGRHGGVGEFKGVLLGDMMVRKFKAEGMLTEQLFKDVGAPAPK